MEADLKQVQKESDTLTGRVDDPAAAPAAAADPYPQNRSLNHFPVTKTAAAGSVMLPGMWWYAELPGEDAAEQLELMRSAFRVIRTVREKHACTQYDAIVQAPARLHGPSSGYRRTGPLARVLSSKYAEHTRCTASLKIYGRRGVELSRSPLSGWMDACCWLLSPLEGALQDYVLTDGKLHADDTPVPVLLPG